MDSEKTIHIGEHMTDTHTYYLITKEEFDLLLRSGMFWEWFPNATPVYEESVHYVSNMIDLMKRPKNGELPNE